MEEKTAGEERGGMKEGLEGDIEGKMEQRRMDEERKPEMMCKWVKGKDEVKDWKKRDREKK